MKGIKTASLGQVTGITEAVQLQLILQDGSARPSQYRGEWIFPFWCSTVSSQFCSVPPSYFVSTFPNCCCHNQLWTIQSKTIRTFKGGKNECYFISFVESKDECLPALMTNYLIEFYGNEICCSGESRALLWAGAASESHVLDKTR